MRYCSSARKPACARARSQILQTRGAGIRTQDLAAIPLNFELSFDKFRTSRNCRLIWRDGDLVGLAFKS